MESLSALVALILAISMASERVVVLAKTLAPDLGKPATLPSGAEEPTEDRKRRLAVFFIAVAASWLTAALVADGDSLSFRSFVGRITYYQARTLPVVVVAVLASGGSAFWSQVLGFAKAAREVRSLQGAELSGNAQPTRRADSVRSAAVRQKEDRFFAAGGHTPPLTIPVRS